MIPSLDLLRRIVRQQTVVLTQPVANLIGAVPPSATQVRASASQQWHVVQLPGQSLPSRASFYGALLTYTSVRSAVVTAVDGIVAATAPQAMQTLFGGRVQVANTMTIPITIQDGSGTSPWICYVDGVSIQQGTGGTTFSLSLSTGEHYLEVLTVTALFGVQVPLSLTVLAEQALPTPVWESARTTYMDAAAGTSRVRLSWYADAQVGSWRLLRQEQIALAQILYVGPLASDGSGEFALQIATDVEASIPIGGMVYANREAMGIALDAAYDSTTTRTHVRMRLRGERTNVNLLWIGATANLSELRQLAQVARAAPNNIVTYDDTGVATGAAYEYFLVAHGLLDPLAMSPMSAGLYVVVGDVDWPADITFAASYPKVVNNLATAKFTTPADDDYAGVHCYWQNLKASGTATSGSLTTLVDSGASFGTLTGYVVRIVTGTGAGQFRVITSNTGTTLTISTGTTDWGTAPTSGSTYEVFDITKVVTDYGAPNALDEFNFTPLGYGKHYFCTFDLAGNVQPYDLAAVWDFASGTETFLGQNQPPIVTIKQVTAAVQQALNAPYNNTLQYAVVELDASDPIDGQTGVVLEYRTRTYYGATAHPSSSTSSTLVVSSGTPWTTDQWKNYLVTITSGTGAGQTRRVTTNSNNTLTVTPNWTTIPHSGVYELAWVSNLPVTTGVGQPDVPSGTRSRYVAVALGYNQNWLQVRAYDATSTYSQTLTYVADFDTTPGFGSINPVIDPLNDTLTIFVTVDDDARSLKWWVDSGAATTISNLDTTKTTTLNESGRIGIGLSDGQRKTVSIVPYANADGTGSAGALWNQEFMRSPRTSVTFSERDAQGALSNSVVQATFTMAPSIPDYTGYEGSGTTSGSNTNLILNDTGKQWVTGTATGTQSASTLADTGKSWTTNQWANFWVTLTGGTGSGQTRQIISNTATVLTVSSGTTNWVTTPVAGSTTYSISRWGKDMFAPNSTTREVYYVRMLTGTAAGQLAKIAGNSPTQLSLASPWDPAGVVIPATGATYQIQKGGTSWRVAPIDVWGSASAGDFTPTLNPVYLTRSPSGDYLEYYSELSGVTVEAVQRAFIDSDSVPSLGNVAAEEVLSNQLTVTVGSFDDDCKEWLLYAKKGGFPTYDVVAVTGTATGTQTSTTLQDTSKSWGTNQYKDYYVVLTGGSADPITGQYRKIISNNSNTLTVATWGSNPVNAQTTYSITQADGQLDPQYLRISTPVTVSSFTFDAGTGVWYSIVIPKDSYNSLGQRVLATTYVDGVGSGVGQLLNVGVVRNDDNPNVTYYNKIQWDHTSASGGMDYPSTSHSVKLYAYRADLGVGTEVEITDPSPRRPWADVGSNFVNSDDQSADVTALKGSMLHKVAGPSMASLARADASNGVQYTWVYTIELYNGGALLNTYSTQHTDWYARPIPQISAATASVYTMGACSLTPDGKGNGYADPGVTIQVSWTVAAGTANDADYSIDIYKSDLASPGSWYFLQPGTTSIPTSYDRYYVAGDGTINVSTHYATYQIKLIRNSDGAVITTLTTSGSPSVTFVAGRCSALY